MRGQLGERGRDHVEAERHHLVELHRVGGLGQRRAAERDDPGVELPGEPGERDVGALAQEVDVRQPREPADVGAVGRADQHERPLRASFRQLGHQAGVEPLRDRTEVPDDRARHLGGQPGPRRPGPARPVAPVGNADGVEVDASCGRLQRPGRGEHEVRLGKQPLLLTQHGFRVGREAGVVVEQVVHHRPAERPAQPLRQRAPERELADDGRLLDPGLAAERLDRLDHSRQAARVDRVPVDVEPASARQADAPDPSTPGSCEMLTA